MKEHIQICIFNTQLNLCPAGPLQLSEPENGAQRVHQLSSHTNIHGAEEAGTPGLVRL